MSPAATILAVIAAVVGTALLTSLTVLLDPLVRAAGARRRAAR